MEAEHGPIDVEQTRITLKKVQIIDVDQHSENLKRTPNIMISNQDGSGPLCNLSALESIKHPSEQDAMFDTPNQTIHPR
jgi:hypothetical protein